MNDQSTEENSSTESITSYAAQQTTTNVKSICIA